MSRKKVLFVCVGNSCRSQMAEGFAKKYGSDVMEPASAGLAPASIVQPLTRTVMEEKGISLSGHFPKSYDPGNAAGFDLIVNLSGFPLPPAKAQMREWRVDDPIGQNDKVYREVRDAIERFVMMLILELRHQPPERPRRQRMLPRI